MSERRNQARTECAWGTFLLESTGVGDFPVQIAATPGHRLTLASRYMNREPMLLEARRKMLYREKRTGGDGGGGGAEDVAAGTGQSG